MSKKMSCRQTLAITNHRIIASDLNEHETVYGGNLLQLLDGTASVSAARFARTQCVTASIEHVDFLKPFALNDSLCIESYVTGCGNSSIEVFVKITGEHLNTGERFLGLTAFMTFVTLDRSVKLPEIYPESAEEKMLCEDFSKRRKLQQENRRLRKEFQQKLDLELPWL